MKLMSSIGGPLSSSLPLVLFWNWKPSHKKWICLGTTSTRFPKRLAHDSPPVDGIFNFSTFLVASMPKSSGFPTTCFMLGSSTSSAKDPLYSCDISYPGVSVCRTVPLFSLQDLNKTCGSKMDQIWKNWHVANWAMDPPIGDGATRGYSTNLISGFATLKPPLAVMRICWSGCILSQLFWSAGLGTMDPTHKWETNIQRLSSYCEHPRVPVGEMTYLFRIPPPPPSTPASIQITTFFGPGSDSPNTSTRRWRRSWVQRQCTTPSSVFLNV